MISVIGLLLVLGFGINQTGCQNFNFGWTPTFVFGASNFTSVGTLSSQDFIIVNNGRSILVADTGNNQTLGFDFPVGTTVGGTAISEFLDFL